MTFSSLLFNMCRQNRHHPNRQKNVEGVDELHLFDTYSSTNTPTIHLCIMFNHLCISQSPHVECWTRRQMHSRLRISSIDSEQIHGLHSRQPNQFESQSQLAAIWYIRTLDAIQWPITCSTAWLCSGNKDINDENNLNGLGWLSSYAEMRNSTFMTHSLK